LVAVNPKRVEGALFPLPAELLTVSARDLVAVCFREEESSTWKVKLNCPIWEVFPERRPPLCSVRPVGRAPDSTDHVYGGVPPVAFNISEYAERAMATDNESVVIPSESPAAGVIVNKALPNLNESALLVAVMIADVLVATVGA
jgi:hypothetical protein